MSVCIPRPMWFRIAGPEQDVAVSCRCRLARNVAGAPFPWRASEDQLNDVARECSRALADTEPHATRVKRPFAARDALYALAAARFVSFRWADSPMPGLVDVAPDGSASVMVNEEDHVRVQAIRAGMAYEDCIAAARKWEHTLGLRLAFARDERLGFLTASLGNTGAGMRLSFLLHLAALAATPVLAEALAAARSMRCSVRGAFGEGTPGTGAFVQVSNRCTFGPSAAHAAEQTVAAARYLILREREARSELLDRPGGLSDLEAAADGARDRLFREDLPAAEVLRAISVVRLGIATGATLGDLMRTGEWMASAGVMAWAELHGAVSAFERMRRMAAIRSELRT
ncbi:MAG: hypothetical protein FJX72_05350 [Armatimonadetes bacterium]|nr:hypothetical protein [Armatimonadota bacterium]